MRIIEVAPAPCLKCGTGNVPTQDGTARRFLDVERDVSWNEPVIFCEDCVMSMGGLMGMLSEETRKDLIREVRTARAETHEAQADMDAMKRRAKRLGVEFVDAA